MSRKLFACNATTVHGAPCKFKGHRSFKGKMYCGMHYYLKTNPKVAKKNNVIGSCTECQLFKKAQAVTNIYTDICSGQRGIMALEGPMIALRDEVFKQYD